jgi:DNA (cytosine-5)-methyltransferase 1
LEDAGYHVVWDVLYCPDFGLAQTRSRLVLLASKLGPINLPKPTHKGRHRTVRNEIGHLPPLSHGGVHARDTLHRASRLSDINARRIAAAKPGGSWKDWAAPLVAKCHTVETGRGYSSVYGRMEWDEPSPTITTQFYGFGNGRFGHPEQDRALSLREGALLQGFPRDYEFVAPGEVIHFTKVGKLIGNAVPVKLAAAIAKAVSSHLEAVQ